MWPRCGRDVAEIGCLPLVCIGDAPLLSARCVSYLGCRDWRDVSLERRRHRRADRQGARQCTSRGRLVAQRALGLLCPLLRRRFRARARPDSVADRRRDLPRARAGRGHVGRGGSQLGLQRGRRPRLPCDEQRPRLARLPALRRRAAAVAALHGTLHARDARQVRRRDPGRVPAAGGPRLEEAGAGGGRRRPSILHPAATGLSESELRAIAQTSGLPLVAVPWVSLRHLVSHRRPQNGGRRREPCALAHRGCARGVRLSRREGAYVGLCAC
mmetsp:Transcript_48191/g.156253  ORF Transcript_48191/g.156253 Transcript_48191/m.156253 type:complete len:271 (-) Transcript_48191:107-919(-)